MTRSTSSHLLAAATAVQLALGAAPASAQVQQLTVRTIKTAVAAAATREYGPAVSLGNGRARSYLLLDNETGKPREIGVALDESALDSLPSAGSGHHGAGPIVHSLILALPTSNETPFRFVEVNWNPAGHEPEGVYQGVPHFDIHFYTISQAERDEIVPTNAAFEARANDIPTGDYVPAFNVPLGPPGAAPAQVAVPMMGVHWLDVRSPELQRMLGKPEAYKPFTATFIHGSWDGKFHFWEPMITRAFILERRAAMDAAGRDQAFPISMPAKFKAPGYYPAAYRVTWDADVKEYRIALTDLAWR